MSEEIHWVLVFDHSENTFHKIHLSPEQTAWARRFRNTDNFVKKLSEEYMFGTTNMSYLLMDELNEIDYDL